MENNGKHMISDMKKALNEDRLFYIKTKRGKESFYIVDVYDDDREPREIINEQLYKHYDDEIDIVQLVNLSSLSNDD